MTDDEELSEAYNLGYSCAKDMARDEITRLRERLAEADEANRRVSDENKKLRAEIMSDYHEGLEEGVKAERERIACKFDSRPHDFWSGEAIAAAIRESGDE